MGCYCGGAVFRQVGGRARVYGCGGGMVAMGKSQPRRLPCSRFAVRRERYSVDLALVIKASSLRYADLGLGWCGWQPLAVSGLWELCFGHSQSGYIQL